jgi:hypothetical protein
VSSNQENEMAAACRMHVEEEKYIGVLMMGKPVIDHLENICGGTQKNEIFS